MRYLSVNGEKLRRMTKKLKKNGKSSIVENNGKFVITLDFELFWGLRDTKSIENYGANILGVQEVIPKMLDAFDEYGIKATFATVGFLFFETKKELLANLPIIKPLYKNEHLSPYNGYFENVGEDWNCDNYHFAPNLLMEIQKRKGQEIGTHTLSHFYCLEEGQTLEAFKNDLEKAINVAKKYNINITSLAFPCNQTNEDYLKICTDLGIICYRGNEKSWMYKAGTRESKFKRAFRLIDTYLNISGHNCYSDESLKATLPMNIPSSRFLRAFSQELKLLEGLRLHRIKSSMTYAAKNYFTYHLWWHPHNFGINQKENFQVLEKILQHYKSLNNKYHFQSYTMGGLATKLKDER